MTPWRSVIGDMMLASPHTAVAPTVERAFEILKDRGWFFEPKWDGVRALVVKNSADGAPKIYTRSGSLLKFADNFLHKLPIGVWDGELVAWRKGAQLPFVTTLSMVKRGKPVEGDCHLAYQKFDLICNDPRIPTLSQEILWRRHVPEHRIYRHQNLHPLKTYERWGWEGLIAKDPQSRYVSGRSPAWVKLKFVKTCSAVVCGFKPGNGSRKGRIGSLELAVYKTVDGRPSEIVKIGSVGTGMTDADVTMLTNLVNKKKPFVVEVEYASYTPEGALRFPSFRGVRYDQDWSDCTYDQLT